jgi:hypothetical protein
MRSRFCASLCAALLECFVLMQMAAAADRHVKAKTADSETALVVAKEELKELEELRKLRRLWGECSKVPLKEQLAESKQTKVAVATQLGQPAMVHNEQRSILLTASIGAVHAVTSRGGSM